MALCDDPRFANTQYCQSQGASPTPTPSSSASPSASPTSSGITPAPSPTASPSGGNPMLESYIPGSSYDERTLPALFWGWDRQNVPSGEKVTPVLSPSGGVIPQRSTAVRVPMTRSLEDAVAWFVNLPQTNGSKYDEWRKMMEEAGLVTQDANLETAAVAFGKFAYNIGNAYEQTGKQRTPEQWLEYLADHSKSALTVDTDGDGVADEEAGFSGSVTQTSSQVRTYSPSEARGLTEDSFSALLGREPTRAERKEFRSQANSMAKQNPVVSTTTTDFEDGDATGSHTVTDGGVDFAQKAINEARSKEGYGEYQAINFFDAMMAALAAPGGA